MNKLLTEQNERLKESLERSREANILLLHNKETINELEHKLDDKPRKKSSLEYFKK